MTKSAFRHLEPFQAGCRHRLAGRPLPSIDELQARLGLTVMEAQAFEGGYRSTDWTIRSIHATPDENKTINREIGDSLAEGIALRHARDNLARLVAAKVQAGDPEGKLKAAFEAGLRHHQNRGRRLTGDEAKRRGFSLDEVRAFLAGYESRK